MDSSARYYLIQLPLPSHPDGWYTVARAITAEAAAEVVRVLLGSMEPGTTQVRVQRGEQL